MVWSGAFLTTTINLIRNHESRVNPKEFFVASLLNTSFMILACYSSMQDTSVTQVVRSKNLLIEGWRGINHSFALVNQYQILEMTKLPGLRLFHEDLPFAFSHWSRTTHGSGLPDESAARIDALPPQGDTKVDCVFRICAPFRTGLAGDQRKTVTFMITELGLSQTSFHAEARQDAFLENDNRIITSTAWSRDRIAEWGFAEDRIDVVPLGVDCAAFYPLSEAERATNRAALGFDDDETVLLNIGIPAWNKGIDVLLRAFAVLRGAGRKVRLVVKDQRDIYGVTLDQAIRSLAPTCPELLEASTLAAISLVDGPMPRGQLRLLYGIADAYVSPYRAEGFNLPVLEAIACGTAVIVTAGGSTDGFCPSSVALHVPGVMGARIDRGSVARYIEPDAGELVGAIDSIIEGRGLDRAAQANARPNLLRQFSWPEAARRIAEITVGLCPSSTLAS